jgi:hypothetical protein
MVVQNVNKEDRDAGVKGAILGNVKYIANKIHQPKKEDTKSLDDLPF